MAFFFPLPTKSHHVFFRLENVSRPQRQCSVLFIYVWNYKLEDIVPCVPLYFSSSLAAQWHRVLAGRGEQPQGLPGGSVVSIVEDQGLLHGKERDRPVPNVRTGQPCL